MNKKLDKQVNNKPKRDKKGRLLPGNTANPKGRPKGKTLKEYAREFLMSMSDKEKLTFLNSLSKETVWKMAEGNPPQDLRLGSDEGIPFVVNIIKDYGGKENKNKSGRDNN